MTSFLNKLAAACQPTWILRLICFINPCTWIYQLVGDLDTTMSRGVAGIGIHFHDEVRASGNILTTRWTLPVQRGPIRDNRAWQRTYNRTKNIITGTTEFDSCIMIHYTGWMNMIKVMGHYVSSHRRLHCLLNFCFRRRSKKKSKLHVTGPCAGNSPVTGECPAQKASNAKMFPIDDVIMGISPRPLMLVLSLQLISRSGSGELPVNYLT